MSVQSAPGHEPEERRYPYVTCDVPDVGADEASALFFELGATGVEARDATTLVRGASAPATVTLIASFADADAAEAALSSLPSAWHARLDEVVGDAWRDEWKKYFEPFLLCPSIFVSPPWRACSATGDERVLILEPGRAFGTGLHETTRLVAEVLADHAHILLKTTVLDVGCGSGILALTAIALGAARARAIDIDVDAVTVTKENAGRNAMADRIDVDATDISVLEGTYAWVVANIEAGPLVRMATSLIARVAHDGYLVLSGILAPDAAPHQWDEVRRAYGDLRIEEIRQKGEWMAAVLRA